MSAPIQGKRVYLRVSDDSETTWWVIICLIKQAFESENSVTETETQCETLIGLGSNKNKLPFEGAVDTNPAAAVAGIGQASNQKLWGWKNNQTALIVQQFLPDAVDPTDPDPDFYKKQSGYLTQYKDEAPINDVIKFSGTFSLFGELDIVP